MLCGQTVTVGGTPVDLTDARVEAGVLMAPAPERVAALRALVWAHLRTTLYPGESAWAEATAALHGMRAPLGRVESKQLR